MKTITLQTSKHIMLAAAVAAVCLASVTVGARAADTAADFPARTVHYADLNLETQAGAAILYKRIRNAAEQVCGDVDSQRLELAVRVKACVDGAIASSVRFVNNPKLTHEYNVRVGVEQKPINVATLR
jgi:UrcA family protein